jgi:hypothetical protein
MIEGAVVGPRSRYSVSGTATQFRGYNTARHSYEIGSRLTATEVKVDCGKDTNWLLLDSDRRQKFSQ